MKPEFESKKQINWVRCHRPVVPALPEVEAGEREAQGHLQLRNRCEANLGHMRSCRRKKQ